MSIFPSRLMALCDLLPLGRGWWIAGLCQVEVVVSKYETLLE
jgi:hypothetical protein